MRDSKIAHKLDLQAICELTKLHALNAGRASLASMISPILPDINWGERLCCHA
jgi:hypothetical protein